MVATCHNGRCRCRLSAAATMPLTTLPLKERVKINVRTNFQCAISMCANSILRIFFGSVCLLNTVLLLLHYFIKMPHANPFTEPILEVPCRRRRLHQRASFEQKLPHAIGRSCRMKTRTKSHTYTHRISDARVKMGNIRAPKRAAARVLSAASVTNLNARHESLAPPTVGTAPEVFPRSRCFAYGTPTPIMFSSR